jgi:hypothetical protein
VEQLTALRNPYQLPISKQRKHIVPFIHFPASLAGILCMQRWTGQSTVDNSGLDLCVYVPAKHHILFAGLPPQCAAQGHWQFAAVKRTKKRLFKLNDLESYNAVCFHIVHVHAELESEPSLIEPLDERLPDSSTSGRTTARGTSSR